MSEGTAEPTAEEQEQLAAAHKAGYTGYTVKMLRNNRERAAAAALRRARFYEKKGDERRAAIYRELATVP